MLFVALLVVTGCSSKGPALVDSYTTLFSTDLETLDYVSTMKATDGDHFANFVDGLFENDPLGNYVPALAESHEVSADGLTHTYKIRPGVKWVTNEGVEYADVKASDWITGAKRAVAQDSDTLYIIADSIVGLADYVKDPSIGFDGVGIKADDEAGTLTYTLNAPESFWQTKLTYGILFPINEDFLNSKGADYGTSSPDSILYNGPYLLSNNTAASEIEYTKNEAYWDVDNVNLNTIKFIFNDGSNPDEQVKLFTDGTITAARVFPNSPAYADVKEQYENNITTSLTDGTTFNITFNFARRAYTNTNKTDAQKTDTQKALLNRNFRLAFLHGFDRVSYRAQNVGDVLAPLGLRNSLVAPTFVSVDGADYGKVVSDNMTELDPAWANIDLSDGQDPYFNADKAAEYMAKAKEELAADGVSFPIVLDMPALETSEIGVNQIKSLKSSVEKSLGADNIVIDIHLLDRAGYLAATYNAVVGSESDYDISNASGWGPDYVDPSTMLNIYNTRTGDMTHTLGLDSEVAITAAGGADGSADAKAALGVAEYDKLLDAASAITDESKTSDRYEAYAKAEAWLTNAVLQIPVNANGGTPRITKVVPFTTPYAWNGLSSTRFKFVQVQEEAITVEQYDAAKDAWDKARVK